MADKEQKKIERLERQGLAEKQKVIKPGECMKVRLKMLNSEI